MTGISIQKYIWSELPEKWLRIISTKKVTLEKKLTFSSCDRDLHLAHFAVCRLLRFSVYNSGQKGDTKVFEFLDGFCF